MTEHLLNQTYQKILQDTEISEGGPGTVLADFETLLDFIEHEDVRISGKHQLFPMSRLRELDQRMTRPLNLELKRPQLRSYPHWMGLYMLLRATCMVVVSGKKRLTLDEQVLESWRILNVTEQYFNLLEIWLLDTNPESVGERTSNRPWTTLMRLTMPSMNETQVSSETAWRPGGLWRSMMDRCYLAAAELFGLCEIQAEPPLSGKGWSIALIRPTPFGNAILRQLFFPDGDLRFVMGREDNPQAVRKALGSYFPQWIESLDRGEREYREGVHYFKVSLGGVWRRLAVPHNAAMNLLAYEICNAFNFDFDHLFEFTLKDVDGSKMSINHPACEEGYLADEFAVGELPLREKDEMRFEYDFGDSWRFKVKLERIELEAPALEAISVVEQKGEPPRQYRYDDDE